MFNGSNDRSPSATNRQERGGGPTTSLGPLPGRVSGEQAGLICSPPQATPRRGLWLRVPSHSQIVEDKADVAVQFA